MTAYPYNVFHGYNYRRHYDDADTTSGFSASGSPGAARVSTYTSPQRQWLAGAAAPETPKSSEKSIRVNIWRDPEVEYHVADSCPCLRCVAERDGR